MESLITTMTICKHPAIIQVSQAQTIINLLHYIYIISYININTHIYIVLGCVGGGGAEWGGEGGGGPAL